ncbi:MAG: hypothetical protein ABR529_07230 [Actinomycetota bacterium]
MTFLLVSLTVVEVVLVVGVLASYLVLLTRRLRSVSEYLGKIAFGVRAVDTQTAAIGPSVTRINTTLSQIDEALDGLVEKAERAS